MSCTEVELYFFFSSRRRHTRSVSAFLLNRSSDLIRNILCRISGMALLILALLQRIFLMSSLMLLLVWLIFFMVLIKLLPILRSEERRVGKEGWLWRGRTWDIVEVFVLEVGVG